MRRSQVIAEVAFLGIEPTAETEGETEFGSGVIMRPATPINIRLQTASWLKDALEEAVPHLGEDDEVQPADFDRIAAALDEYRKNVLANIFIPDVMEQERAAFAARFETLQALRQK